MNKHAFQPKLSDSLLLVLSDEMWNNDYLMHLEKVSVMYDKFVKSGLVKPTKHDVVLTYTPFFCITDK